MCSSEIQWMSSLIVDKRECSALLRICALSTCVEVPSDEGGCGCYGDQHLSLVERRHRYWFCFLLLWVLYLRKSDIPLSPSPPPLFNAPSLKVNALNVLMFLNRQALCDVRTLELLSSSPSAALLPPERLASHSVREGAVVSQLDLGYSLQTGSEQEPKGSRELEIWAGAQLRVPLSRALHHEQTSAALTRCLITANGCLRLRNAELMKGSINGLEEIRGALAKTHLRRFLEERLKLIAPRSGGIIPVRANRENEFQEQKRPQISRSQSSLSRPDTGGGLLRCFLQKMIDEPVIQ
ncbi:hypothetical protein DNTS_031632 [Danionella cerebrum]|uniref:Uncharacterized protein n=1 Tax=Danionella cerebrum TaxID=2873325 RepID=A0A553QVY7_9TELE|nr:hypothetical protein DNTS_031632 [Danionella translucida]TRY94121.1 hypothetical protein DNTS_031632 [Danionella translucida]